MRIFFSVGEPSGDLHASNLIRAIKSRDSCIEVVGFGGPKMRAAGCGLLYDLTELAVMFLKGAIANFRKFTRLIGEADEYFANHPVDAVVLIDFSGFNWWIARKAKKHGIPVFYFGVPQMWAWAPWRIHKLRRLVDHVLCKLPFEEKWFRERGCQATFIGHPYFDQMAWQTLDRHFLEDQTDAKSKRLLVLPGSRNQEVERTLPMMLETAGMLQKRVAGLRVTVGCYNLKHYWYASKKISEHSANIECVVGRTQELMKLADVCLACSGSVSLELLHHRKPTVIVYKIPRYAMVLQSVVLRAKYITLVNLLNLSDIKKRSWLPLAPESHGDEMVMPEFLTTRDCPNRLSAPLFDWLTDEEAYRSQVNSLDRLARNYARPGATIRAAEYILDELGASKASSPKDPMIPNELSKDRSDAKTAA